MILLENVSLNCWPLKKRIFSGGYPDGVTFLNSQDVLLLSYLSNFNGKPKSGKVDIAGYVFESRKANNKSIFRLCFSSPWFGNLVAIKIFVNESGALAQFENQLNFPKGRINKDPNYYKKMWDFFEKNDFECVLCKIKKKKVDARISTYFAANSKKLTTLIFSLD